MKTNERHKTQGDKTTQPTKIQQQKKKKKWLELWASLASNSSFSFGWVGLGFRKSWAVSYFTFI